VKGQGPALLRLYARQLRHQMLAGRGQVPLHPKDSSQRGVRRQKQGRREVVLSQTEKLRCQLLCCAMLRLYEIKAMQSPENQAEKSSGRLTVEDRGQGDASIIAGRAGDVVALTGAMNRYPRPCTVSMKWGVRV
jgi:hypothetical protein